MIGLQCIFDINSIETEYGYPGMRSRLFLGAVKETERSVQALAGNN